MQTDLSRTTQTTGIIGSMRGVDLDDKPRHALGIVDGLLSVTQQEWNLGPAVKQSARKPKVTQ